MLFFKDKSIYVMQYLRHIAISIRKDELILGYITVSIQLYIPGTCMFNIISRLQCLKTCLSSTAISQLNVIVTALLAMTGRVTMLGISRWAGEGGSYRTVQRFFNTPIAWAKVHWCLIRHCFLSSDDVFVIAGDETVVTKSGKITWLM
jgi:hypothetical protein